MPTSYFLSSTDSDLIGGGDFTKLLDDTAAARSTLAFTVANEATETSHGVTDVGVPSADGGSGSQSWTVKVDVDVGSTSIFCSVRVTRINAAGSQQAISAATAEQQCTAGVKTFTLSLVDLGTWAAGDRLRVLYLFRSSNAHGGAAGITIGLNTADSEVTAPWTIVTSSEVDLTPASLALAGVALDPVPGSVAVNLTPASISLTGVALDPQPQPGVVNLTPAEIAFSAPPIALTIPLGQLTDDFDDASLDTSKWEQIAGTVTEAGGQLELDNATTYAVVRSNPFVDATESEMVGEWTMYTGVATGSAQSGFKLFRGAGATYGHLQIMRTNVAALRIAKTEDNVVIFDEGITYNATDHKWLRVRLTATQTIFEASADGINWTQPWTNSVSALPTWALDDGVKVEMFAGYFNAGQPDPGTTFVDNFNLPPTGAAQVNLVPAEVALSAVALDPQPGTVSVNLTPAEVALSAVALDAAPGVVSVNLTPAELAFSAVALSPGAGATQVNLTPAELALSGVALDPQPGVVQVNLTPAILQLVAVELSPVPFGDAVLTPAVLNLAAVPLDPQPGSVSVNLTPAELSLTAVALSPGAGATQVNLTPAEVALTGIALDPQPGTVSVNLVPAEVALTAPPLNPIGVGGVILTPAVLSLTAVPLDPQPGLVSVTLTPAEVALTAVPLDPQGLPGSVNLSPAEVTFQAVILDPQPGAPAVTLVPAVITLTAVALSTTIGVASTSLTPAEINLQAVPLHIGAISNLTLSKLRPIQPTGAARPIQPTGAARPII
jgi:hypothetical protein